MWQSPSELFEHQPTVRLDYNLTNNHRLNGSWSSITAKRTPDYLNNADPRFPGAPNQRDFVSTRPLVAMALRSVLSKNIVNEVRGGLTAYASGSNFGYPSSSPRRNDPSTFADSGGFAITTPTNTTDWFTSNGPSWRKAPTYSIEDTLTWNRGAHTIMTGGNFMISNASSSGQTMVHGITLGFNTDFDPAAGLFNTTNFPGASSDQLNAARATYAVLTGRVATVASTAVLQGDTGQYQELAPSTLEGGYKVFGMFAQDTWRVKPNLTVTGGLRYDIQTPFVPFTSVMSAVTMASVCGTSGLGDGGLYSRCNVLAPGASGGAVPQYILLEKGSEGYKTDLNNIAPSASIAWRPNVQSGFLSKILGDPDQATLRAGYSEAYDRQGLTRFTGLYGNNRGASVSLNRTANTGLRHWCRRASRGRSSSRRPIVCIPRRSTPIRPIRSPLARTGPTASTPSRRTSRSRACGPGRSASRGRSRRDMAVEIRYVGNRGDNEWEAINYNAIRGDNLVANGFLERVQAGDGEPRGEQRVGRFEPGRLVRLLRIGHGHDPAAHLPGVPQWPHGCRQPGRLRPTPRTTWANTDDRRPARGAEPEPDRSGRRSRRQPDAPQPGPGGRHTRRTSSSSTPT